MQVVASAIQMSSVHQAFSQTETRERLHMWVGDRSERGLANQPAGATVPAATPPAAGPRVDISDSGRAKVAGEAEAIDAAADAAEHDPMLRLLRKVIEWMTGRPLSVFDARALARRSADTPPAELPRTGEPARAGEPPGRARAGFGIEYEAHYRHTEVEQTRFRAEGVVVTADGREVRFSVSLEMARSYHEESRVALRAGDAVMKDPLVINFAGTAAQLSDQSFSLDLDGNGDLETARFVASGSGFLVFDRNGDGQVNDGSELFGPASGNGFAELAALDEDGNGWVDAGDANFARLGVWTQDAAGSRRIGSLADYGIGALFTGSVATPFALKDSANASLGQIVGTGLYLKESGAVGTMQQIDLAV